MFELGDPWMLLFLSFLISWSIVTAVAIFKDRRTSQTVGVTSDPTFFDRVTRYHNEI